MENDPTAWILLAVYVGGALSISFLCSVLEATLLSARIPNLMDRRDQGDRGAEILLELKQNRLDDAISAILTLNTMAHTVGATLAGAQASVVFGDAWVGVFSGVLTLLVLVVTEIIPKTLGAVHARRLTGFVGRTTRFLTRVLKPILFLTSALTRLFAHQRDELVSRGELAALVSLAAREGALKGFETKVLENVLELGTVRVRDVMTPRIVAVMMPGDATLRELAEDPRAQTFSRIPIFGKDRDEVLGYVLQREALRAGLKVGGGDRHLVEFARSAMFITDQVSLPEAMKRLIERKEQMAIALDEFGGTSGLITLEDVVETMLGLEIMDESDKVADLRKVAEQLRDHRISARQQATPDAQ